MRILVVGAGAIGGYFGGRMVEAGADVTFLVRARRAGQLAAAGLVVRSPKGNIERRVATVQAGALGGRYDAVLLSCKAYDLEEAMDGFAPGVGAGTAILPLLNGMRHMEALGARFGAGSVLGGQCQIAATLEPDGVVRHLGALAALSLGEQDGTMSPRVETLAGLLAGAGGRASETIIWDMWEKWVFLASLAALTSLMRASIGDVEAAGGAWVAHGLFDEAAGVAAAAGYAPRPAFTERMRGMIGAKGLDFTASMMRDIERGGPIEGDHVVGDLVARAVKGTTPLFDIALVHLRAYEARRAREKVA